MFRHVIIYFVLMLIPYEGGKNIVLGTIDVNLSELKYLADHLKATECRRLAAALHYDRYELPEDLDEATRKVSREMSCLQLLLHWNSAEFEGLGATHEHLGHRLRQLGHEKLADWLGKTTFNELGKDLLNSLDQPIADEVSTVPTVPLPPITSPTGSSEKSYLAAAEDATTNEKTRGKSAKSTDTSSSQEQNWFSIDIIVMLSSALLLFMLTIMCGICLINRVARCESEESVCETEDESEKLLGE